MVGDLPRGYMVGVWAWAEPRVRGGCRHPHTGRCTVRTPFSLICPGSGSREEKHHFGAFTLSTQVSPRTHESAPARLRPATARSAVSLSAAPPGGVLTVVSLSTKGNQILSGLSIEEYKTALKIIKQAILATDLALYIK